MIIILLLVSILLFVFGLKIKNDIGLYDEFWFFTGFSMIIISIICFLCFVISVIVSSGVIQ